MTRNDPLEALRKAERDLISSILYKHRWFTTKGICHCGWSPMDDDGRQSKGLHADHQTDMLLEAAVGVKG